MDELMFFFFCHSNDAVWCAATSQPNRQMGQASVSKSITTLINLLSKRTCENSFKKMLCVISALLFA